MSRVLVNFDHMKNDKFVRAFAEMKSAYLSAGIPLTVQIQTDVSQVGAHYCATIRFFSNSLRFVSYGRAKSPYVAIEGAACDARDRILIWMDEFYGYIHTPSKYYEGRKELV